MHPNKFFNEVKFINEVGGDISKPIKEYLKDIHPSQMILASIETHMYEVNISYLSESKRWVDTKKFLMLEPHENLEMQIQLLIEDWAEKTNMESGYNKISNVKVDGVAELAKVVLNIG